MWNREGSHIWNVDESGWKAVLEEVDLYLADVIARIAAAYADKRAHWLQISFWPDSGRLIVYPSDEGPFKDGDDRLRFQLCSSFLQSEWERSRMGVSDRDNEKFALLSTRLWGVVEHALRSRRAADALAIARQSHPMKIAAFDYEAGEGNFYLTGFDRIVTEEISRLFAEWMTHK